MSDLADVLDVTEPVECEYLNHKITAHVYTAGVMRFRKEDRDRWVELTEGGVDYILMSRAMFPVILAGWDFDGTPMEYRKKPFPPTEENLSRCPDAMLLAVGEKVFEVFNAANPTDGNQELIGSLPEEAVKEPTLLAESISH